MKIVEMTFVSTQLFEILFFSQSNLIAAGSECRFQFAILSIAMLFEPRF